MVQTRRLDDVAEMEVLDLLKIDVQGSELSVFRGGRQKLRDTVAVQAEVSFVPLYENQPTFGDIDQELRHQSFIPHAFIDIKRWAIAPFASSHNPRCGLNQLPEADIVYVRDFTYPDDLSPEQLKLLDLFVSQIIGVYPLKNLGQQSGSHSGRSVLKHYTTSNVHAAYEITSAITFPCTSVSR